MEVYLGKIYKPIVFGDAAPSVQSFMSYFGGNLVCTLQSTFLDGFLLFFLTDVHHSQIYTSLLFGDAVPSVPSFIGSKVIFWFTFLFVL